MSDKPKFKTTDFKQLVKAADGNKPHYYPSYRFTGRNFVKRDVAGKPPNY